MSCGGATQVQLVALTAVDSYLTAAATSTFFAYRSMPYAVFGLEFAELQLTGAQTLNEKSTTQGTCTIDRRGDKLAKIYLQFKADAIMNITQDAITIHGASVSGDADNGLTKHRGIVAGGTERWIPVRVSATQNGAFLSTTNTATVITATGIGSIALPGDRVRIATSSGASTMASIVSRVKSTTADTIVLEVGTAIDANTSIQVSLEREVSCGSLICSQNPCIREDYEQLIFTKTAVDGPRSHASQSVLGFRYRGVGGDPHDLAAYYRPFAPCLLIDTVTLLCGSQCLDTLTASALVIYHELYVPKHAQGVRNLNATRDINQLKKWALQPQVWRMLLPFNMCTSYAKALSLVSICLHNLKLNIKFNPVMVAVGNGVGGIFLDTMTVNKLFGGTTATNAVVRTCAVQASDSSITPWIANSFTVATDDPLNTPSSATFKGSNIACTVLVEYVYTGKAEREMEVNLTDRMVVVEHQTMQNIVLSSTSSVTTQITVNHPIASIFCTAVSSANTLHGDKHNYDGFPDPLTWHRDAPRASLVPLLKTMQLKFNSAERTPAYDTSFYREILNVNALKNTPDTDICAIHFGIASAYDPQQSGSANLARLERVDMVTTLNPFYVKDNTNVGGLDAVGTTVTNVGEMSAAHQVTLTFDFLSVNVWEVKDCMMGRMYA
jgi:hypothetical protein